MKGSLKLATVAGIGVYVHWTFLVLLAWIFGAALVAGRGTEGALLHAGFVLAVFGCVVLHEFGHAMAARAYGIGTRDITLLPIGGVARLERMPERPLQEIVVALAGPAVNVGIAALLGLVVAARGSWNALAPEGLASGEVRDVAGNLLVVNIALVVFNMIPAFPMDGGRVLRALLASVMDYARATRIAASVGQAIAIGFALLGLFGGNPLLILVALFVWLGAQGEAQQAETRALLSGLAVREAMITDFRALREDDTLAEALQALLGGSQPDFPVMEDGRVVGVLARDDLLRAIASSGPGTPVGDVMRRDCAPVEESDGLSPVVQRMSEASCPLVPVTRRGELVGLLTPENIGELLMIRSTLGRAWRRPGGAAGRGGVAAPAPGPVPAPWPTPRPS